MTSHTSDISTPSTQLSAQRVSGESELAHEPSPYDPVAPPPPGQTLGANEDAPMETGAAAKPSRFADYKKLVKLGITRMVVITAAIGFFMGVPGSWRSTNWVIFAIAMLGTALSCMAASVFNQLLEIDVDALMTRTQNRPLPAGRIDKKPAWWFASVLGIAGVGLLVGFGLYLAAGLCLFTIVTYAWVYTPLKRTTSLSLIIGAVPGAMPPMIGYAAVTGRVDTAAWLLFAVMFVWQVPHFLAIAWLYREQYAAAGLAMLPVIDPSGVRTFRQTLISSLLMLPLGLLPTAMGVSGVISFAVGLVCGLGFLAFAIALVLVPTRTNARRLFFASLIYLPLVMGAMLLDRV